MTTDAATQPAASERPMWRHLLKLARPHQWGKSGFVFIGPVYRLQDLDTTNYDWLQAGLSVFLTAAAFALASSGLYVINDIVDAEQDRAHPRKRNRPIASGAVPLGLAKTYAAILMVVGITLGALAPGDGTLIALAMLGLHLANVLCYSALLKRIVIIDVVSLSMGFVLRVIAGCAAIGVAPTTWLLNATLFLSMFLAFGKRLGERRTMGSAEDAARARGVQAAYSDPILRMLVVVAGVATLLTYASYINDREASYTLAALGGFNLLWPTVLPAMYGLLRCITLLEAGRFDDPTELAVRDRPFQLAAFLFAASTVTLVVLRGMGLIGDGATAAMPDGAALAAARSLTITYPNL